jgi:hypothetical protein
MWVPGYRNSIVHALEFGLGFRKHPVVMVISYVEISTYFHVPCIYSQNFLLIRTSHKLPPKKSQQTFSFPTLQRFSVAVYVDKPNTPDISI